jgi:hypothetical protein
MMRAREAVSAERASMFAIALATSSVKPSIRCSVSCGSGAAATATIAPQILPSTTIGVLMLSPSTGNGAPISPQLAIVVTVASEPYRSIAAASTPMIRPTSSTTAEKTTWGDDPRATSVATRRSAVCSSASAVRSVTSLAMPYTTPSSGIVRVLHSNRRTEPSAQMMRLSKLVTSSPAASESMTSPACSTSSGWTKSMNGRVRSSSREYPSTRVNDAFTSLK